MTIMSTLGARQLAMQLSVLVVKLQLGPLHFPCLTTWHLGKKSDGSDRSQVFWLLLRLMFLDQMLLLKLIVEDVFGVFWMGIGLRCFKSTFFRMQAGQRRKLHLQNEKRNDPTKICL